MAAYKHNPQLVSSYDIIKRSDIVGTLVNPIRWTSQQPPGFEALLSDEGSVWFLNDMSKQQQLGRYPNLKAVKDAIVEQHNADEKQLRESAVAWTTHWLENPQDKANTNPQLVQSIFAAAARARIHPSDSKGDKT